MGQDPNKEPGNFDNPLPWWDDYSPEMRVQGFPTIKYGDPSDLKDYSGGRDFDSLKKFADENLGPQCGPEHMDLCDEKMKSKIEGYLKMSVERMEGKIRNAKKMLEEEAPVMKKVIAHLKKQKSEL